MRHAGTLLISLVAGLVCGDNFHASYAGGGSSPASDPPAGRVRCAADNGGITLPAGFCASVFADRAGRARHIAVTPMGRVFVAIQPSSAAANDGHVLALFDADNDGVAEQRTTFGIGGNGIAWRGGQLFVAANDRIVRYAVPEGTSSPQDARPIVVASGLPATGDHRAKTVVIRGAAMYVNFGSPSDSCQVANRQLRSPGKEPCPELATRAGVWQFDATADGQRQRDAVRIATGMRNTNALAIDPATGTLWGAINGRDQLHENWPDRYSDAQDQVLPAEELVAVTPGTDRGWPYCYYDAGAKQMTLTPEYGGDGVIQGRCSSIPRPPVALPAHAAPLGMVFATGAQFPAAFRSGAFVANHGSRFATNGGAGLHGYDVELVVFSNGRPTGEVRTFATGFDAGRRPLPDAAPHRPVGLAMMPDGSLLIGDDKGGRIWRVFYTGT
jgi:glucose/arabinose dehydrogenase